MSRTVWVVTEIKNNVLSNSVYNTFTECCDYIKDQFEKSNNLQNYNENQLEKDMFIGSDTIYYIRDCTLEDTERTEQ